MVEGRRGAVATDPLHFHEPGHLLQNNPVPGQVLSPWHTYTKSSEIVNPAPVNLWVFINENPDSINDAAFAVDMDHSGADAAFVDGPTLLHNGGCGFGFADGHAEIHKWQDSRTLGPSFQTHYADDAYFATAT